MNLPAIGQTYDLRERVYGVVVSDYHRVVALSGTTRRSVYTVRHGTGREHRFGLDEFNRRLRLGSKRKGART